MKRLNQKSFKGFAGWLAMAVLGFVLGCQQFTGDGLEGVYVNRAGSAFSVVDDTLEVKLLDGDRYEILRSTGFRLLDESGKPGKLQHESERWLAVWGADKQVLTEQRAGKVIVFDPSREVMSVGKRKYKRIK